MWVQHAVFRHDNVARPLIFSPAGDWRSRMRTFCFVALVGVAGCAGKAPSDPQITPDAAGDGATPTNFMLSGKVIDYFGNITIGYATVTTDGLEPARMTTTGTDGAYQLDVAVGSVLFLVASKTDFRATRNE